MNSIRVAAKALTSEVSEVPRILEALVYQLVRTTRVILGVRTEPAGQGFAKHSLAGIRFRTGSVVLRKGMIYVQIHSEGAPDGNLRGWLLK